MNSRERVLAVFNNEIPDRVPCWCGASTEFWEKAKSELSLNDEQLRLRFRDDFRRVFSKYVGPEFKTDNKNVVYRTVFGIERSGIGYGHPLTHPLADAALSQIDDYCWPDPEWIDVSSVKSQARVYDGQYAILGGEWCPFWHDAIDLLGMENLYIKMYTEPEVVHAVLEHVVDFYFEVSKRTLDAAKDDLDIFFIGNDFGSQTGPLLGVNLFDKFMLPHLQRLCSLGHGCGLKVQMHCCGGFEPLFPSMIKAGIDSLHAIQSTCSGMDLAKLKADYGNKIVLNGGIDSHHILIDGTPQTVRSATRNVLDIMMPGGGYIAGASHDTILEETPVENILAMFDAVYEFGNYKKGKN